MDKLAGDQVKAEHRRRQAIRDSGPDPDQEAKARRQAQLEQRHLQVYRNMHHLRDALCRRYAALLKDKVQSQRLLLQHRQETVRAKSENDAQKTQKKVAFSKLQHNDSYLKSLPKTSFYLICDLQKQLAERGRLKTHSDLEEFYRCIKYNDHPSKLQISLQDVKTKMLESRSAADLTSQDKTSDNHLCSTEDRGHEDHVCHSRLLEQGSDPGEPAAELIFGGSRETGEFEQMFPKIKLPTFATLQPNFMKNFQNKMTDLIIPGIPEKSRKAEVYLKRLKQMHDLCLSNMAVSQRLLDRESDLLCWQEERGVQDLVLPDIDSKQRKRSRVNQPPLSSLEQPHSVQNGRPSSPEQLSTKTSASQQHFETLVWSEAACCRKTPDPLCIEDVCQQKHVVIIDRGFEKLWSNYT